MNKIFDADWMERMDLLVTLLLQNPNGKMKRLQAEALKYYPLYYTASIRNWMSANIGLHAAELANKKEGLI